MDKIFEKYINNSHKEFSDKLIPNSNILGIKNGDLRLIAKEYISNNDLSILDREHTYHEEKMVYMYILSYLKDPNMVYKYLDLMVPNINNWAVCDCLMNIKMIRKNRELFHNLIIKYKNSDREFEVRFVLIMLFHYMDSKYLDEIFEIIESVKTNDYYSRMGLAWLICECFIKFRDYTLSRFKDLKVDTFSYNKAISKICDSFRVTDSDKELLKNLRRK